MLNGIEWRVVASTCLAKQFDLFENAMVWVQYCGTHTTSSRLNHCNCFSQYRGSLVEETKKKIFDLLI